MFNEKVIKAYMLKHGVERAAALEGLEALVTAKGGERSAAITAIEADYPEVKETPAPVPTATRTQPEPVDVNAQINAAMLEERGRVDAIRTLGAKHGLEESVINELCTKGNTVAEANERALAVIAERQAPAIHTPAISITASQSPKAERIAAFARCLLHKGHRSGVAKDKYKLETGDNEFMHHSLINSARGFLAMDGVRGVFQMSNYQVAERALQHSSDFPELLANVANKSLQDAYDGQPNTFSPFVDETEVPDFKEKSSLRISKGKPLPKVLEHGEYKRTSLQESAEKYKVEKFGEIIGNTWELLINDDLNAFTNLASGLGQRAREKENEIFWGLILANAGLGQTMAEDATALFDLAAHNNLQAASVIDIAALGVIRGAMRLQRDLDGELIRVVPAFLVVPSALETRAEQFISQITPNLATSVNPFSQRLQLIVEPRLDASSATRWYVSAAKAQIAMAEMARLDGRPPEIFTREGFSTDGMETKIRYVFGMRILDFRGFQANPGL